MDNKKAPCGCRLAGPREIIHCAKHGAADDLLAALEKLAKHRTVHCRFTITKKADDCYTCGKHDRLCEQCSEVVAARAAILRATEGK